MPKKAKLSPAQLAAVHAANGARLKAYNASLTQSAKNRRGQAAASSACYNRAKAICDANGNSLKTRRVVTDELTLARWGFMQAHSHIFKQHAARGVGQSIAKGQKGAGGMAIVSQMWKALSASEKRKYIGTYVPKK